MNRPRLFLPAVSEELRNARNDVAAPIGTLGFDPVSQDDFPTGYGELRQWLRMQLDSCEGLPCPEWTGRRRRLRTSVVDASHSEDRGLCSMRATLL